MKTVQKFFVCGLLTAGLIFVGCGDSGTATGGDSGGDATPAAESAGSDSSSESAGGSDTSSTATGDGEFQMVSLDVPNMT